MFNDPDNFEDYCSGILLLFSHKLCSPFYDSVNCSTPGILVLHYCHSSLILLSIEPITSSNHLIFCCLLLLLPSTFHSIRVFSNESACRINGQSSGASTSVSVFPMNIQGSFPLGLTGLISLLSKGTLKSFQHHNSKASIL